LFDVSCTNRQPRSRARPIAHSIKRVPIRRADQLPAKLSHDDLVIRMSRNRVEGFELRGRKAGLLRRGRDGIAPQQLNDRIQIAPDSGSDFDFLRAGQITLNQCLRIGVGQAIASRGLLAAAPVRRQTTENDRLRHVFGSSHRLAPRYSLGAIPKARIFR